MRLNPDYALGFGIDPSVLREYLGEERTFLVCHEVVTEYLASAAEDASEFTGGRLAVRIVGDGKRWTVAVEGEPIAVQEFLAAVYEVVGLESATDS